MTDTTQDGGATGRPLFDLAVTDILAPSEEGRPMYLIHPSGAPYRVSTGERAYVTLRSQHSAAAQATLDQISDEIAQIRADGRALTNQQRDEHDTRYLTAVTVGWNIERLDGEAFLVTPANVQRLWTDKRFARWRRLALEFVQADANFLPPPA